MSAHATSLDDARRFVRGPDLADALTRLAGEDPHRVYLRDRHQQVTAAELDGRVDRAVQHLRECGVDAESRVGLALPVKVHHVVLIFALLRLRALWLPLNPQLRGEPLAHQLGDAGATHVITEVDGPLVAQLSEVVAVTERTALHGADGELTIVSLTVGSPREQADREDASLLMYTSGTTGPPKGVLVSETMLKMAVLGSLEVTTPVSGDVFYVWEPLFHIGGAQVVFLPLFSEVTLALAPKFSASRFWSDVRTFDVTHIHYLGGVLQILLQLPPSEAERDNRVKLAWGAGATPQVRDACRSRYQFPLAECYGMTEASSVVTVNRDDPDGGVGEPFSWVEIDVDKGASPGVDDEDDRGEILVRGLLDGMLTTGYLGNAEATAKALSGQWYRTGDLGFVDDRGRLHFAGRLSDSIRVRGENISAWQVESAFELHPDIDRCAVIGVEAEVGEQEMLLAVTEAEGCTVDPEAVLEWAESRLARFQIPRYVRVVPEMPLTPSQRIAKHRLKNSLGDAVRGGT